VAKEEAEKRTEIQIGEETAHWSPLRQKTFLHHIEPDIPIVPFSELKRAAEEELGPVIRMQKQVSNQI
jgi:hypothetical protein